MSDTPKIIVITGPTATGKTALGVQVAKLLDGEVIGADSMQVYKGMTVGTAAPTAEEMEGVPHHMVGFADPLESYSVSRYVEDATQVADDIIDRGKVPIVVGGTGLYIDSLIDGREFGEVQQDPRLRTMLEAQYDKTGGETMLAMLHSFDPDRADKLHPGDKRRIVRAIEVYLLSGQTITDHDKQSQARPKRFPALKYALDFRERETLYQRIGLRVDRMEVLGLFDEVQKLLDAGADMDSTAMQAIGYKEPALALQGALSREEALDRVKQSSRQYAKRQLTWLRRDPDIRWITWEQAPDIPAAARRIAGDWRKARQNFPDMAETDTF